MARRRLLTLLAATAVLTGSFAGTAFAEDALATGEDLVTTVTQEALPDEVTDALEDEATAPATQAVTDVVDEVADTTSTSQPREEAPTATPSPSPAPASSSPARTDEGVVAAGRVTSAPDVEFLGSLARTDTATAASALGRPSAGATPLTPTADDVAAPMVAPAPAAAAAAPSVLAQALDDLPEEGVPALALVAMLTLLAAGTATVREATAVNVA